jgi:DNA-binding GntR family transcriptional regulator
MKGTSQVHRRSVPLRNADPGRARAHDAYAFLLTELLEGELGPGDWLSVVDIANQLGCSRVPVMEAIKRLAGEGFVVIVPQVGCRVAMPAADEVGDFFALFAAVEGCVTRLAAERRTTQDLRVFREVCARIDRELKRAGDAASRDPLYRHLNLLFHTEIHRMAGAPSACRIAAAMWDRSDFYIKVAFGSLYFTRRVRQAHLAIRRALVAGDGDRAERAVKAHLRAVGEAVSERLRTRVANRPP